MGKEILNKIDSRVDQAEGTKPSIERNTKERIKKGTEERRS